MIAVILIIVMITIITVSLFFSSVVRNRECFKLTSDNVEAVTTKPDVFDMLDISDAMNFKDHKSAHFKELLKPLDNVSMTTLTDDDILHIIKQQVGDEYEIVFLNKRSDRYDVVFQQAEKMYGVYIVVPVDGTWAPKFIGFIFDDKINLLATEYSPLSDFQSWPF